jgi:peptide/nickel transport system permease protein
VRPLRGLRRSRRFVVGSGILGAGLVAVLAARLGAGDPFSPSETLLTSPSGAHPLGTDELGRDVLARVVHGASTALLVSFPPAVLAAAVGTAVGLVAGYAGGIVDELLLKLTELVLIVPRFLLALVVVALFGGSLPLLALVLAATFWPATARLVRAEAISLRERPFVEAARALGASDSRIVSHHLLRLVLPIVAVNSSFQAGQAVLIEAGLAFLGLGDRNVISWGAMLSDAQTYLGLAWWTALFPGLALSALVLSANLIGDGIADTWNVRARR